MRSVSVVLPESMWAEIPMLRMRSIGIRAAKEILSLFGKGGQMGSERLGALTTSAGRLATATVKTGRRSYFEDGNENVAPSRTPAEGQRWVMVLRFV